MDCVIINDEIGNGIVPVDAFERITVNGPGEC